MREKPDRVAVVGGAGPGRAGPGLGMALCERLLAAGYAVAGLTRRGTAHAEFGEWFRPVPCDVASAGSVEQAITEVERTLGVVDVYIHNAAYLLHREFLETSAEDFADLWRVTCLGAVHGAQRVLPAMLEAGSGALLFTGATVSVKAGGRFSAFASAKFALRGLAQSLAREYGPSGIHVAHVVIDGAIWGEQARAFGRSEAQCLDPADMAETYLRLIEQPASAWTHELDIRPRVETF